MASPQIWFRAFNSEQGKLSRRSADFATDQFNNRDALDGYREIGLEIAEQLDGPLDAFTTYIGVGGCFLGTIQGLGTRWPQFPAGRSGTKRVGGPEWKATGHSSN